MTELDGMLAVIHAAMNKAESPPPLTTLRRASRGGRGKEQA